MEELLSGSFTKEVSILASSINLVIAMLLSLILKYHFEKFSLTLSGKKEIARSIPFLALIVCFIINIVKSSLALSLGLVGALSIVRFRTPIKEPEELIYLFMSIAIGLACGANQTLLAVVSTAIILILMAIIRRKSCSNTAKDLYLSVTWNNDKKFNIDELNQEIKKYVTSSSLKRLDINLDSTNICYSLTIKSADCLVKLPNALNEQFPSSNITFIDQSRIPGI